MESTITSLHESVWKSFRFCMDAFYNYGRIMEYQGKVIISESEQNKAIVEARTECESSTIVSTGTYTGPQCNATWDGIMCWPATPVNQIRRQSCPNYINGFFSTGYATRRCMSNGRWYIHPDTNTSWTNYTDCMKHSNSPEVSTLISVHLQYIQLLYTAGYCVSLVSLIIAVFIMIYFRKLHCPRNTVHVNMFFSFILRAVISLVKDLLMVEGLGFASDVETANNTVTFITEGPHWECKLLYTLFHYILSANYMWIFVEGLYLHTLVMVSVFSERGSIRWYLLLGWVNVLATKRIKNLRECGLRPIVSSISRDLKTRLVVNVTTSTPMVSVLPWVTVRITNENTLCWNTNNHPGYFWILKLPIVLSILVNFVFFINILRALFTKLQDPKKPRKRTNRYRRIAKSTLILIPLFGVHYIVFIGLPEDVNATAEIVKLYFEMFFNSFQGFIVAILFCFLNPEAQMEIKKKWYRLLKKPDPRVLQFSQCQMASVNGNRRARNGSCKSASYSENQGFLPRRNTDSEMSSSDQGGCLCRWTLDKNGKLKQTYVEREAIALKPRSNEKWF